MSTPAPAEPPHLDIATIVATHGFAVVSVGYGPCSVPGCRAPVSKHPWTYTVGLVDHGLPELVLFGLHEEDAFDAVHWTSHSLIEREVSQHAPFDFYGVKMKFADVPRQWLVRDRSRMAMWFEHYPRNAPPTVLQLLWPDDEDRFPDDPSFDPELADGQPLLRANPFRFPRPYDDRRRGRHRKRRR